MIWGLHANVERPTKSRHRKSAATRIADSAAIGDPVFALIGAHKALWPRVDEIPSDDGDNPEWVKAVDDAADAMRAIAECQPTTLAGCRAAATYIAEHPANRGHGDFLMHCAAHDSLAAALKALVP